jgi:SAM-dependent methyltransferase
MTGIEARGEPLDRELTLAAYPRSAKYAGAWMVEHAMGPNPLWLVESVTAAMELRPGMHVLDLGCGKALTSVFLAREFGVQVWAGDLWIPPGENLPRIEEAGAAASVFPFHCEAHALPFAPGFLDAVVSIDAYHYFGTDDLYLATLAAFVKPGGQLGIAVPGLAEEPGDAPPEALAPWWEPAFWSFHSAAWWRRHWERSGCVDVALAEDIPGAAEDWLHWSRTCAATLRATPTPAEPTRAAWRLDMIDREVAMLEADAGANLRLLRMVARRK